MGGLPGLYVITAGCGMVMGVGVRNVRYYTDSRMYYTPLEKSI